MFRCLDAWLSQYTLRSMSEPGPIFLIFVLISINKIGQTCDKVKTTLPCILVMVRLSYTGYIYSAGNHIGHRHRLSYLHLFVYMCGRHKARETAGSSICLVITWPSCNTAWNNTRLWRMISWLSMLRGSAVVGLGGHPNINMLASIKFSVWHKNR